MTRIRRLLPLLLAVALFLCSCAPAAADGEIQALFINVGKADAALFFLGEERYLIDTGTKDSHEQLMRVLEAYGVDHLHGVLVTHTDKDHAGGLKKMLKTGLRVDRLYAPALHSEKSLEDHRVYEAAEQYGVPLTWLHAGESLAAADGSVFHVLGPLSQDNENENNNSLVLRLVTAQGEMLLTGDMEREEEAELMQQGLISQAQVLKVAHHGEGDSTSRSFALVVRPQWAIISTNTEAEPDTPDSDVLSNLRQARASIAVTQQAEVGIMVTLSNGQASAQQIDWQ